MRVMDGKIRCKVPELVAKGHAKTRDTVAELSGEQL